MIRRYLIWASAAYVVGICAMTWVNVTVLCRGDPKFDRGCGGFELYAIAGLLGLAPVFASALMAGFAGPAPRRPAILALLAVVATLGASVALEAVQERGWSWGPVLAAAVSVALTVGIVRIWLGRDPTRHRAEV